MTKAIRVATLVLMLSVCVQAGIMQTGKTDPPPPPPPPAEMSTPQDETEMEVFTEGTMQFDLADAATRAALASLQSLLTLL